MDKNTFRLLNYGLYVVSSRMEDRLNGQIANAVFQVSSEPPMFAVCINKENLTHTYIKISRLFSISILSVNTPLEFIGRFGFRTGREFNKFENVYYEISQRGTPIVLDNAVGFIECELEKDLEVFTHTIFVGRALEARILKEDEPMSYEYYQKVKRGKVAPRSPTYL